MKLRSGCQCNAEKFKLHAKLKSKKNSQKKQIKNRLTTQTHGQLLNVRVILQRLTPERLYEINQQNLRVNAVNVQLMDRNLTNLDEEDIANALEASLPSIGGSESVEYEPQNVSDSDSDETIFFGPIERPADYQSDSEENDDVQQQQQQRRRNNRKMEGLCARPETLKLDGSLAGNWKKFKTEFEIFMTANECLEKSDVVKIALFKNLIGYEALEVLNSLELTAERAAIYNEVIAAMDAFCKPRKNAVYERHNFYKRVQHEGESFDAFLMDIKRLVKSCDFGSSERERVRC